MEIIPLIPERDVAIQRARVAQNRDVRTQAKACLLLGRYHKEQGELDKAEELYQRALAKARQWQDQEMEADACSGLGLMYQVVGRMDKAVDYLNAAFEINRERGDEERLAVNYSNRGFVAQLQGKVAEAQELHIRAQQFHETSGNRAYWAEECGNLGQLALQRNKPEEAEAYFRQGLNVCQELGDLPGISGHYQGLGLAYLGQKRLAEAEAVLKKGIAIEEQLQRAEGLVHHYSVLGGVYSQMGRFDEAEDMYRRTLATQQKLGNRLFEARTVSGLGQVLRGKGDTREATALFQQARELFDVIGDNKGQAVQAALLGDIYMDVENFKDVPAHAMLGKHIRLHTVELDYSTSPPKETPIEVERTIAGVLAPLPGPSILRLAVLVPAVTAEALHFRGLSGLFVELEEGIEPAEVETRLEALIVRGRLRLQPFVGAHLGPSITGPADFGGGTVEHIYLLVGLAALVLLIAAINFVNLAMSRAMTRTLEVGLRKAIGATRHQLSNQFLAEAIIVSLIAIAGGMALAEMLLPAFNQVVQRQLELEWLAVETGIGVLTLALVVGVLSGLYPAQIIARLHPVRALASKAPQIGRGLIGRGLIVLQFALSTLLIVVTITMERQRDFMRTKDLGFDGDQVVRVHSDGNLNALQIERLASEINSRPGLVKGVAGASPAPGPGAGFPPITLQFGETSLHAKFFHISEDFLRVMGIEVLAAQNDEFGSPHGIFLNETAVRLLGLEDPIGRTVTIDDFGAEPVPVIGVVEDFHFDTMQHTIGPALLTTSPRGWMANLGWFMDTLFRLDHHDLPAAVEEVETLWKRVLPEYELQSVSFLDEAFAERYETERRVGVVMGWMGAIAIVISCMGLFGLVALATVRRTKEIGIRKVLGATTSSVLLLMSREFGWLVVAANVVAWPVAYLVLNRWLAFYAYRVDMGVGWFALAGVGVLAVALATVSSQTWLAARTNPADALIYE